MSNIHGVGNFVRIGHEVDILLGKENVIDLVLAPQAITRRQVVDAREICKVLRLDLPTQKALNSKYTAHMAPESAIRDSAY